MRRILRLLVPATALLWTSGLALTVDVTPVHRPSQPLSPHEPLVQRWTVAPSGSSDAIRNLEIDTLCDVVASYAPSNESLLLATVTVSGSDFKLITAADVLAPVSETVAIRLLDVAALDKFDGFVRVNVVLHAPHLLCHLNVTGDGTVTIMENVLVENDPQADVVVDADGDGRVFLPSHLNVTAKTITFSINGSANLYLPTASTITAPFVSFLQAGSGQIVATSAALEASYTIAVASGDTGSVCVDATFVQANAIKVHATSRGDVYVGGHDGPYEATQHYYCDVAQVFASGAGNVDLGTILCIDIGVDLYGSGNVTVASARSLGGHAYGTGKILYAMGTPDDVMDVDPWAFLKQPIALPAYDYAPRTCAVPEAPSREATRIVGRTSEVHHVLTPTRIASLALLALGFIVVFVLEKRRQRESQAHRSERTPLLH